MEKIIAVIASGAGIEKNDVRQRINEKIEELSGLVSEEAAAYIVAKELGVELNRQQKLRLENVAPGMQNVEITGKITKIFQPKTFHTKHGEGRVQNVFLADESASLRMSLWNDEIDKFDLSEGDVVIARGYVKEDNVGGPEMRLGKYGTIQKSEKKISVVSQHKRARIGDLREGVSRSVRAPLIQVFESNVFFDVCSKCGLKLADGTCKEHGEVEPDYRLVITGIIDDGTGSVRAVFFGESAETILGMTTTEAKKLFDRKRNMASVLEKVRLGKEFVLEGRARRNALFDRLEFIVNSVKEVDAKKEISMLLGG